MNIEATRTDEFLVWIMNGLYVNFKFANFRDGLRQRGDQVFFLLKGLAKSTPKKKKTDCHNCMAWWIYRRLKIIWEMDIIISGMDSDRGNWVKDHRFFFFAHRAISTQKKKTILISVHITCFFSAGQPHPPVHSIQQMPQAVAVCVPHLMMTLPHFPSVMVS